MTATYHKLNNQKFIIQLGTIASADIGNAGATCAIAPLEGELVYVPNYEQIWVGKSDYTFAPCFGTVVSTELTGDYTMQPTDQLMYFSAAGTATLQSAEGTGKKLFIKNIGAATVTVAGSGADTIDGVATQDLLQWEAMTLINNAEGTWVII